MLAADICILETPFLKAFAFRTRTSGCLRQLGAQNEVLDYTFNPGTVMGDTVINQTGNGNNGLLVGNPAILS